MSGVGLWPHRVRVLRGPAGMRVLVDLRVLIVTGILIALALVIGAVALTFGESDIEPWEVPGALLGIGDPGAVRVVANWRLPRVVLALLGGAALALSGAIFQSMTRNPLGSPDIIGFSTGAYSGTLVVSLVLGLGGGAIAVGAFVGGLAAALAVYLLAYKRGIQGFRLIVVGIAVSATLAAINAYLLANARLEEAVTAAIWGAGSLNGARWPDVLPVAISLVVLVPACILLSRRLSMLELGDDHARMLGISANASRVLLLIVGVGLVSIITAVAGPITFVALAAPQIARRLTGASGPSLLPAALTGAVLLLMSDVLAQRVIAPGQFPVGVVTACLGGAYLVWLMASSRKERA